MTVQQRVWQTRDFALARQEAREIQKTHPMPRCIQCRRNACDAVRNDRVRLPLPVRAHEEHARYVLAPVLLTGICPALHRVHRIALDPSG